MITPSLLLTLWRHIAHKFLLIFLSFFQVFFVHTFHHLTHNQSETNHPDKWVLQVCRRIKRLSLLKVLHSTRRVQIKRVHQYWVSTCVDIGRFSCYDVVEEWFKRLCWVLWIFDHFNNYRFKVIVNALDLKFIKCFIIRNCDCKSPTLIDGCLIFPIVKTYH